MKRWHTADVENRLYCVIEDGKKISMPRYFKDKMYTPDQRQTVKDHFFKKYVDEVLEKFHAPDYQQQLRSHKEGVKAAYKWNKIQNKNETL